MKKTPRNIGFKLAVIKKGECDKTVNLLSLDEPPQQQISSSLLYGPPHHLYIFFQSYLHCRGVKEYNFKVFRKAFRIVPNSHAIPIRTMCSQFNRKELRY